MTAAERTSHRHRRRRAGRRPRWSATPTSRRPSCCSDAITDALEPLGLTRADVDFTCLGSLRLHHRPGVLLRGEPRRHRRLAAQARLPRRDGRRLGALRGVAPAAGGRHRDRRRHRLGPLVHRRPSLIYPMEMDPYFLAPLGADPLTFAALQARAAHRRGHGRRAVHGRGGRALPRQGRRRDVARRGLRAPAAAPPRPAPDHRRRRRHGARHRRSGPPAGRAPGLHHRLRPPHRVPQPVLPGPRRLALHPHRGGGRGPRRRSGRGRRAPGRLHPRGAPAAPGARPRRRRGRQPVGRRAERPTRSWPPACAASATPPTTSSAAGAGRWPTRRRARACNRTSSASWRDGS